ncbi:MAG: hypothetical protein JJE39_04005 [Vicinamibacteria bacterium]|nr:hypothetical protein [Vicinamibacteria bacterium]
MNAAGSAQARPRTRCASSQNRYRQRPERLIEQLAQGLAFTPALEAAAILGPSSSVGALAALTAWMVALVLMLVFAEGWRIVRRSASSSRPTTLYDRIAAVAGPTYAPLVAKALRYLVRSPQVRNNLPVAMPPLALVGWQAGGRGTLSFSDVGWRDLDGRDRHRGVVVELPG